MLAAIAYRVIRRHVRGRDHGFYPTVVEELLRELYLANLGAWVWDQMKEKAAAMWLPNDGLSGDERRVGSYVLEKIAALQAARPNFCVDLVGHSAGSIAICELLRAAAARGVDVRVNTIAFLAPAGRSELGVAELVRHPDRFKHFRCYTMLDDYEREDQLVPRVYTRSLLYFISGVLEPDEVDAPIMGMTRHASGQGPFQTGAAADWAAFLSAQQHLVLSDSSVIDPGAVTGRRATSHSHGGFDDDGPTRESLIELLKVRAMPEHANHYALVVGIDHYPRFRPLKGARKDAEDFHAWLIDPEGGSVPAANVELVLSNENPLRPIHDDIDDALERLLSKARNETGDKRLYLYFSGHGLGRSNVGADLCLAAWSKQRRAMALDSMGYLQLLMGCGYFREVIFLLDCCRVREVRSTALPPTIELPGPGDAAPASRSFVGYATEFMNVAYEAETGQAEGGNDVRGHFTRALMAALKGSAAEPTGGVRASKLKEYLEVNTPLIAKASSHIQKSEVVNGLDAAANPLFGHAKPPAQVSGFAVILVFKSFANGEAVVEDGQLCELKRGDVSTGPWHIPVSGRTMLLVRHLPTGTEKTIRVQGNETEDLHVEF